MLVGLECDVGETMPISPLSSIKRKSPSTTSSVNGSSSPRKTGDFFVLQQSVTEQREEVRRAREGLALSLDLLGEHHVRQREFDQAMDAFTEALQEKRTIYGDIIQKMKNSHSSGDVLMPSYLHVDDATKEKCIKGLTSTLRSLGNVHSLRGEQDEAMRYYTEVTNLRARLAFSPRDGDESTGFFSSGGFAANEEENSALMSEINEDVKALDDMFQSISFRNRELKTSKPATSKKATAAPSPTKRHKSENTKANHKANTETEPFRRSSSLHSTNGGDEITEALELYKQTIKNLTGSSKDFHEDKYASLKLKIEVQEDEDGPTVESASDLEIGIEIYQSILKAKHELEHSTTDQKELFSGMASILIRLGSLYYKVGNRVEELRVYEEARDRYVKAYGEEHPFVAGTRKNIGMVLAERGEYEEAAHQFELAKETYLSVAQGDKISRDVASAISCLGNVKNRQGDLDEALEQYMEALSIYKAVLERTKNPEERSVAARDVTSTLKVIGMVYSKNGQYDDAMGYFTEAMTLIRLTGVDSTPAGRELISSVLTRTASIHVKRGDYDRAMENYREAYDITVSSRGTVNHHEVAGILHYIGGIHHKRSEFSEAMNCYQEAIRIYHATLGPGNPTVAGTLVMVGSIHYKRRNLDSAMMFYREALRLNRDAYGFHHPDVAPILKSIGTILTKKGEYDEAYDIFRDVLSIKCTIHGTSHPEVANAYKSLGNVHYKMGELADAERQYRHALSIYRRVYGEDHEDTVSSRTTIDHIRYWMKERQKTNSREGRQGRSSNRRSEFDERSC